MTVASLAVLSGHTFLVHAVRFSPDQRLIVSASEDGSVRIWDTATYALRQVLWVAAWNLSIAPNGRWLALSLERTIQVVALTPSIGAPVATLTGFTATITGVSFSPDSSLLVTSDMDSMVRIWDTSTWDEVFAFQAVAEEEAAWMSVTGEPMSRAAFFPRWNPTGTQIAFHSRSAFGLVHIWDLHRPSGADEQWSSTRVHTLIDPNQTLCGLAYTPDGHMLAVAEEQRNRIWLYATSSYKPCAELRLPDDHLPTSLVFSPDGQFLMVAANNGLVWIWQLAPVRLVASFAAHTESWNAQMGFDTIGDVDWSPDGTLLATCGMAEQTMGTENGKWIIRPADFTVKLWNVKRES